MRVKLPDIEEDRRWKRGRVVEVETQDEVAELVAKGGVLLEDETFAETGEQQPGEMVEPTNPEVAASVHPIEPTVSSDEPKSAE